MSIAFCLGGTPTAQAVAGCSYAHSPHPTQVARLQRELERHTDERDKAREEGKRAEQERVQLLLELKVGNRGIVVRVFIVV